MVPAKKKSVFLNFGFYQFAPYWSGRLWVAYFEEQGAYRDVLLAFYVGGSDFGFLRLTWLRRWSGWGRWGADGWLVSLTCQGVCLPGSNSHQHGCGLEVRIGRRHRWVCGGSCHWRCIVLWRWGTWRLSWVARGCWRIFSPCRLLVAQRWSQWRWAWWVRPKWNSIGVSPRFSALVWFFWWKREEKSHRLVHIEHAPRRLVLPRSVTPSG